MNISGVIHVVTCACTYMYIGVHVAYEFLPKTLEHFTHFSFVFFFYTSVRCFFLLVFWYVSVAVVVVVFLYLALYRVNIKVADARFDSRRHAVEYICIPVCGRHRRRFECIYSSLHTNTPPLLPPPPPPSIHSDLVLFYTFFKYSLLCSIFVQASNMTREYGNQTNATPNQHTLRHGHT